MGRRIYSEHVHATLQAQSRHLGSWVEDTQPGTHWLIMVTDGVNDGVPISEMRNRKLRGCFTFLKSGQKSAFCVSVPLRRLISKCPQKEQIYWEDLSLFLNSVRRELGKADRRWGRLPCP